MTAPLRVYVDVTDTVSTHWRAGIQRVVLQVLAQLQHDDRLEVEPVVWLESARSFRLLSHAEIAALEPTFAASPGGPDPTARSGALARAVAAVRPTLGRVRRFLKSLLVASGVEPVLRRARNAVLIRTRDRDLAQLAFDLPPGSVLFDMDTVWNNLWVDRSVLYDELHDRGVGVASLVHDLLPQEHPEWFEESLVVVSDRTIRAQLAQVDLLLVTSVDGDERVRSYARSEGLGPVDPMVVTLGADGAVDDGGAEIAAPPELRDTRYALVVGTIEPRKNHTTLLDAFDRIWLRDPDAHLVVVGRPGWQSDDVIARILDHPRNGERLHWYREVDDSQLASLYADARVVAVASLAEGYGLPVTEALSHGVPVVASDRGALVEAGAGLVDHVPATDVPAWADALGALLVDDTLVARRREGIVGYRAPTWAATGNQIAALLVERFAEDG